MQDLPRDILVLLFKDYIDIRSAILCQRVCKHFQRASKEARRIIEQMVRAEACQLQKRDILRIIAKRQIDVKDRKGNPYDASVWNICEGCGKVFKTKNIRRHQVHCKGPNLCKDHMRCSPQNCANLLVCKFCNAIFPNWPKTHHIKRDCMLKPAVCGRRRLDTSVCQYQDVTFRVRAHRIGRMCDHIVDKLPSNVSKD